ncbi:MAG: class I lanthipeptide [Candidatus Aminicenantes bacterium]|nr:MAG: class I lanthipeptide [Candidatus Aminicenantes bacterium]
MKPLKFNKRLRLNKTTIADLNKGEMKNAHAGEIITSLFGKEEPVTCITCPPCPTELCTAAYTNCTTEGTSLPPDQCCICAP